MQGSENLALDLDPLTRVIIPPWGGRSVFNMQLELDCTATHLINLLKRSTEIFDLQSQSSQAQIWSYNDWANFLSELAKSTYWTVTDPESISISWITVPPETNKQQIECHNTSKMIRNPEECTTNEHSKEVNQW